jgi:hypothetical protein
MSLVGKGERFEDGEFYIHYYMKNGKGTLNKKGYESIKDLERRLEEAREVLAEYIERREKCKTEVCMNSLYDLQEQLKEKGE